jgi:hypothetical protein
LRRIQELHTEFAGLFTEIYSAADGDDEEDEQVENDFYDRYGWLVTVDELAKGDKTQWDFFFNLTVIEFLNMAGFEKAKAEDEARRLEDMQRQLRQ